LGLACCLSGVSPRARADDEPAPAPSGNADAQPDAGVDAGLAPQTSVVIEETDSKSEPPPFPAGEELQAIGDYIRGHSEDVHDCYTERVRSKPTLQGKMHARFQIGPNGRVIGATADGISDPPLLACVIAVVRKWEFDKPASGGKLSVVYPFVFKPIASQ